MGTGEKSKKLYTGRINLVVVSFAVFITTSIGFASTKTTQKQLTPPTATQSVSTESVWIMRSDGALSCSEDLGQSLSESESELKAAKIPVLSSKKGSDGKMHIQMCGASTGSTNSFLIPKSHLRQAAALGYKEVSVNSK